MAGNILERKSYRNKRGVFRDREHAGLVLGKMLERFRGTEALVFAVPSGGVPVAALVAESLSLPLDIAVVNKITLPWNTEAGYGAVAFDGTVRLNTDMLPQLKLRPDEVNKGIEDTKRKVMRRANILRGAHPFPDLSKRPVIVIDDGLASGITMSVAAISLNKRGASRIIIAVPTGHEETVTRLSADVESLYCANIRGGWSFAVADAYETWNDVSEEEARLIIDRFR